MIISYFRKFNCEVIFFWEFKIKFFSVKSIEKIFTVSEVIYENNSMDMN